MDHACRFNGHSFGANMKLIIGLILAICVGIGCCWFGIPLPGPPAIMGAAMAVAMATGYTMTDYWLRKEPPSPNPPGGPPAAPAISDATETTGAGSGERSPMGDERGTLTLGSTSTR